MADNEKLRARLAEARGLISRNRLLLGEYEGPQQEYAEIHRRDRRERIAVAAMQGMLASSCLEATTSCREMAEEAVAMANALIRVLDRDEK